MSIEITVRLADESVRYADQLVSEGSFTSRASYRDWLVRRDMMLRRSLDDLDRLAQEEGGPYPELTGLAATAATTALDLDSCGRSTGHTSTSAVRRAADPA